MQGDSELDPARAAACKLCGAGAVVRFGRPGGRQRYRCRSCGGTFMEGEAGPGMRTARAVIDAARQMRARGLSLRAIRDEMARSLGAMPSTATLHAWTRAGKE